MPDPAVPQSGDVDEALALRLEQLAERRAAAAATPLATASSPRPGTRRHPARSARRIAAGLTALSTTALTSVFTWVAQTGPHQISGAAVVTPAAVSAVSADTTIPPVAEVPTTLQEASAAQTSTSTPQTSTTTTTVAVSPVSVVDGGAFHNRWGDVQVEVTFGADGSITDVVALHTPGGRNTSIRINNIAVPQLVDETLSVQSADVHTVSGATYTSNDYRRSLQSAIDAAREAGLTSIV